MGGVWAQTDRLAAPKRVYLILRNSKIKSWVAMVSLAIYALAASGHSHGLVLCIEASGEIAIEAGENGSCVSFGAKDARGCPSGPLSITEPSRGESHCRSCIDILIPEIGACEAMITPGAQTARAQAAPLIASIHFSHALESTSLKTLHRPEGRPAESRTAHLRCVVLQL